MVSRRLLLVVVLVLFRLLVVLRAHTAQPPPKYLAGLDTVPFSFLLSPSPSPSPHAPAPPKKTRSFASLPNVRGPHHKALPLSPPVPWHNWKTKNMSAVKRYRIYNLFRILVDGGGGETGL